MAAIEIVVDDREGASGLPEALARRIGSGVRRGRLELGDVAVGDAFLIERKAAADLVESLLDRRLDRQLAALAAAPGPARPVVIVEGHFTALELRGIDPVEVRQAMLAIQFDWGLPLIRSRDLDHTAQWIGELARRAETRPAAPGMDLRPGARRAAPGGGRSGRKVAPPIDPALAVQVAALKRVPGLGPAKARRLLEHFGSLSALRAAGETSIAAVPGIGEGLARAVRQALG